MISSSVIRSNWRCVRFNSPLHGLYGSVVEADDDVLGVAWDLDQSAADVRALGEAIERSALHEVPFELISAPAAALGPKAIRLADRVTFSAAQRAETPPLKAFAWDEDAQTTWTPMRSDDGDRLVPVDLVRIRQGGEDALRPQPRTSIGTACGADWESALSRALLESVERHAVAAAVYRGTRAVPLDPLQAGAGNVVRLLGDHAELRVGLVPAGSFGAFVAIAAVLGAQEGLPQAAFGSSARLQAEERRPGGVTRSRTRLPPCLASAAARDATGPGPDDHQPARLVVGGSRPLPHSGVLRRQPPGTSPARWHLRRVGR